MTISTEINRIEYTGNGATTAFSFPYKFFADTDLEVYVDDVLQTLTTNYTVAGAGLDAGGTVTFVVAPASLAEIIILRVLPFTQETDYVEGDPFPAETHEDALDRAAMRDVQLKEVLDRAIVFPVGEVVTVDTNLPATTANYYLAVNGTRDGLVWVPGDPPANTLVETQTSGTSQTAFTLTTITYLPGTNNLSVYVDGVYQSPSNYVETSGTVVTFGTAVPDGLPVTFVVNQRTAATATVSGTNTTYQYNNDADTRTVTARLRDSVSVLDFGADPLGLVDSTQAFVDAGAVTGALLIPDGTYLLSPSATIIMNNAALIGDNAILSFQTSVAGVGITLPNARMVEGITFDGNSNYFATGNDHYILYCGGTSVVVQNCVFQNIDGIEDQSQYALGIFWNTQSIVRNCNFASITGSTNSANTNGFCGGIFIVSDPLDTTNVIRTTHLVDSCKFSDIWTTDNAAAQNFPDSDAIRNFVYDYSSLSATLQGLVNDSKIRVQNCTFVNCLKSATKLNNCRASVEDCRFNVDNANGQTVIFSPFRYQTGPYYSVKNVSIDGLLIGSGVLCGGDVSEVDGVEYTTTFADTQAISIISTSGTVQKANINNVTVHSASALAQINACDVAIFNNCTQRTTHTVATYFAAATGRVEYHNCQLKGNLEDLGGSYTCTDMLIDGGTIDSASGTIIANNLITNLRTSGWGKITSTGARVINQNTTNAFFHDVEINVSGTVAAQPVLVAGTLFEIRNMKFTDTSGKTEGIYSNGVNTHINGLTCNSNATIAQVRLQSASTLTSNSIHNCKFTGGQAQLMYIQRRDKIGVFSIHTEVANSSIQFFASVASTAAVVGFTGTLAGAPFVVTNYTVSQTGIHTI